MIEAPSRLEFNEVALNRCAEISARNPVVRSSSDILLDLDRPSVLYGVFSKVSDKSLSVIGLCSRSDRAGLNDKDMLKVLNLERFLVDRT
ncbi:hypothetical protein [Pseudoxanthobacter soli]|uniref:hypothetical protein n=1 Tax=Pseudoxanthobacter soli TaxID=433840 RepID=UPI0015882307|nr:hypothetical protein [Pseudoxanthobacter soli]